MIPAILLGLLNLILDAGIKVSKEFHPISVESAMNILHHEKNPGGVPSANIVKGTIYHPVVIELKAAKDALLPLMNALKTNVSERVTRTNAIDHDPRVHVTIGYVLGTDKSEQLPIEQLNDIKATFSVNSLILDFPAIEEFRNKEIPLS